MEVAQGVISVGVSVLLMDMQTKTNASINQTWYLIQDIMLVDMWKTEHHQDKECWNCRVHRLIFFLKRK